MQGMLQRLQLPPRSLAVRQSRYRVLDDRNMPRMALDQPSIRRSAVLDAEATLTPQVFSRAPDATVVAPLSVVNGCLAIDVPSTEGEDTAGAALGVVGDFDIVLEMHARVIGDLAVGNIVMISFGVLVDLGETGEAEHGIGMQSYDSIVPLPDSYRTMHGHDMATAMTLDVNSHQDEVEQLGTQAPRGGGHLFRAKRLSDKLQCYFSLDRGVTWHVTDFNLPAQVVLSPAASQATKTKLVVYGLLRLIDATPSVNTLRVLVGGMKWLDPRTPFLEEGA